MRPVRFVRCMRSSLTDFITRIRYFGYHIGKMESSRAIAAAPLRFSTYFAKRLASLLPSGRRSVFATSLTKNSRDNCSSRKPNYIAYTGAGKKKELPNTLGSSGIFQIGGILLGVNLCHVLDQHQQLVGIAPLVVVPGNYLYERVGQSDTSLCVEDGGACIA